MDGPTAFEGPHFRVIPRSGPLVVFFSGTNKTDGTFDFGGFAQRTDASVILVNNGENRWYQNGVPGFGDSVDGTARMFKAWADHLGASELCFIGASMGGSAAAMFASLTGGRALAFSFEARIRAPGTRSARYIPADFPLAHPDLTPLLIEASQPIVSILGGDDLIDLQEAIHLATLPTVRLTLLKGMGHDVPRQLRNAGVLDDLLSAFVTGDPLPHLPGQADGLDIGTYARQLTEATRLSAAGDHAQALALAAGILDIMPDCWTALTLAGKSSAMLKNHKDALSYFGAAERLQPDDPKTRQMVGVALRGLGRLEEAIAYHAQTLSRHGPLERVLYDQSLALWTTRRRRESVIALTEAIEASEKPWNYAKRLQFVARQIGLAEKAGVAAEAQSG